MPLTASSMRLGVTVPHVASSYIYPPATKSDGSSGPLEYGMRFVLRQTSRRRVLVGRVNVIKALKTYGMFVVDQGASFEIDSTGDQSPEEAALWREAWGYPHRSERHQACGSEVHPIASERSFTN
jgi:hypothetical protein